MNDIFCEQCAFESTDDDAGDARTVNGTGLHFYGHTNGCPQCGSTIRTLWLVFIFVPLWPMDSYRFLGLDHDRYLSRRTRLAVGQVNLTYIVACLILAAGSIAIGLSDPEKGPEILLLISLLGTGILVGLAVSSMLARLVGKGCLTMLCFWIITLTFSVATIYGIWGHLHFHDYPQSLRMAIGCAAPAALVLPGLAAANLLHPSRVTPRVGPYDK